MTQDDFMEMFAGRASEYKERLIRNKLARLDRTQRKSFDILAGVLTYKDADAVIGAIDKAAVISPADPIGADTLQATVSEMYPGEAYQIMAEALR